MCVIAFSPKGIDIPTEEQIEAMWKANPDGAGYAFVGTKGNVVYRKGFMTLDSLLKELKHPEQFKDTNFAIHFRIGTSGKNDAKTCHPFPITTEFRDLQETSGVADSVLFHNGIIGEGGITNPYASDTQDFVIAMTPLLRKYTHSTARDYYVDKIIEGNRLLILYKNNAYKMYGEWKKDGELWVSNLTYKYSYKWSGEDYYNNPKWWEEWYEEYYTDYPVATVQQKVKTEEELKADKLWEQINKKEYSFVTEAELKLLKKYSDDYTPNEMIKGGYGYGYDAEQQLIWVEYTPVKTSSQLTQEELELEGELELEQALKENKEAVKGE